MLFFYVCWPYTGSPTGPGETSTGWKFEKFDEDAGGFLLSGEEFPYWISSNDIVFAVDEQTDPNATVSHGFFASDSSGDSVLLKPAEGLSPDVIDFFMLGSGKWTLREKPLNAWPSHYADDLTAKEFLPAESFLAIDPLLSLSTAVASRSWVWSLTSAAVILVVCVFVPRGFCGYLCPLGTLIDLFDWSIGKRVTRFRVSADGWWVHIKILFACRDNDLRRDGCARIRLCRGHSSDHEGNAVYWRAHSIGSVARSASGRSHERWPLPVDWSLSDRAVSWIPKAAISGASMSARAVPCFLWPTFGEYPSEKSNRRASTATSVWKSAHSMPSNPILRRAVTDCTLCQTCGGVCPTHAIKFVERGNLVELKVENDPPTGETALGRRGFLSLAAGTAASLAGSAMLVGSAKAYGVDLENPIAFRPVRPPGSVPEKEFLQMCIRCGECFKACPNNVLQSEGFQQGVDGLWTPIVNADWAGCESSCNACGQVCPTGAIRELPLEEKKVARMGLAIVNEADLFAIRQPRSMPSFASTSAFRPATTQSSSCRSIRKWMKPAYQSPNRDISLPL